MLEQALLAVVMLITLFETAAYENKSAFILTDILEAIIQIVHLIASGLKSPESFADEDADRLLAALEGWFETNGLLATFNASLISHFCRIYLGHKRSGLKPTAAAIAFFEKYSVSFQPRNEEPIASNYCRRILGLEEYRDYRVGDAGTKEWWLPVERAENVNYAAFINEEKAEWEK